MTGIEDARELLVSGIRSFLGGLHRPAFMQIALSDAPAVLGWTEVREIDARYGLGLVTVGIENAMDAGLLPRQEVRPLAHLLLGALGEAAFLVANAEDRERARREAEEALLTLLGLGP